MLQTESALVMRQVEAYNAHNVEDFVNCYTEDAVCELHFDGEVSRQQGRAEISAEFQRHFEASPKLHCTVQQQLAAGPFVVYEEHITGVSLEGLPSAFQGVVLYKVEQGLISSCVFQVFSAEA